jgi:nitrogenase molybdenum-iron protein beta chain
VTQKEMAVTGDSKATLALGYFASEAGAKQLDIAYKVPFKVLDIPLGLSATDRFIESLSTVAGVTVPDSFVAERGRLVDVITDMSQYFYGKKVALFGDPDQLIPLTEFLIDLNMKPVHMVSGTPGKKFMERIEEVSGDLFKTMNVENGPQADMFLLHQWIKNEKPDLLIGNTYGKYIARDEGIPFIRMGFPILDRIGHSYFPTVGYTGGIRILEKILDALLDHKDATCSEIEMELVL